ncbi:MAG TPA: ATP-binding protein, partial [Caldilineaceae bacterium]|nr:ATP-binding protein [Caldilineaceae bacterium]
LQAAVDMLSAVALERAITFVVLDNWPAQMSIIGDRERVEQVLSNLLSNAVKFSPDGRMVIIRSDQVDGQWRVEIEDQGIGIPAAEIPSLFQRFYRASTAVENQIQGTGLGLYVCKAIVEGHQGAIGLVSQEGEGTTVWFTLPARVPTATDTPWPEGTSEDARLPAEPAHPTGLLESAGFNESLIPT